jgi:hypothetical protein
MIVCLQTRKSEIHYISWLSLRGYYYTMCGKVFFRNDNLNTYGIDESIRNACINCRKVVEHKHELRTFRGDMVDDAKTKYLDLQDEWDTPQDLYEDLLDRRHWDKLRRIKNKMKVSPIKVSLPRRLRLTKRLHDSSQFKRK